MRWGSLQRSPRPPSWTVTKGMDSGRIKEGGEGKEKEGRKKRREKEGGRGGKERDEDVPPASSPRSASGMNYSTSSKVFNFGDKNHELKGFFLR